MTMQIEFIPAGVQTDGQALAVVMEADELAESMVYVEVNSAAELRLAAEELRNIVTKKDMIEATFKRLKKPFDIGIQQLRDFFDVPIKRLAEAEGMVKGHIASFQLLEQARVSDAKEEVQEVRQTEVERLKSHAADLEIASITASTPEEAEQAAQDAAEVRSQINAIESLPPPTIEGVAKATGISGRANWKGEVIDIDLLHAAVIDDPSLWQLFKIDDSAMNNLAKLTKNTRSIPGLRFFNKGSVAVRRNRNTGGEE